MRRLVLFGGALTTAIAATANPMVAAPLPAQPTAKMPAPLVIVPSLPRTGAMTPRTIELRPMSPAEIQANAIWSLRAGLNVAALQCQFSPYLATVRTYNDLLKHHSAELATAQATMIAHFKRYDGARALNSFDQYSTRIYNSYSTLDAQFSFCTAAAMTGRPALLLNKGGLGSYAVTATPILRAALAPGNGVSAVTLDSIASIGLAPVVE